MLEAWKSSSFEISHCPRGSGPAPSRRIGLARSSRYLILGLLILGVVCRLVRYGLQFPFWGDECFLCVNFLDRDYIQITGQLENNQVAPLLFLWSELTVYHLLGSSEWAMRLLPELASLASLGLFWHLARMTLGLRGAILAIGLLAVARWPVTMEAVVKPYSLDLLFSLVLLVATVHYLRRPERVFWLVVLTLLVPVALLSSYPVVFVAGGISLVSLPVVWRQGWRTWAWFAGYNLLLIGTFLGNYLLVGLAQLDPVHNSVERYMLDYWRHGFPPREFWYFPFWLVKAHTGRLMAYPIGDAHGGSTVTLLFFLAGVYRVARQRRWAFLGLCLLPFGLNLVAAFCQRYPYGGCCRLSQHLAPAICLLAGTGLAWVIDLSTRSLQTRWRSVLAFSCTLALFGFGEILADIAKPWRDAEALWSGKLARLFLKQKELGNQVVISNDQAEVEYLMRWQLGRCGHQLKWRGQVDWDELERGQGELLFVHLWSGPKSTPEVIRQGSGLTNQRSGWFLVEQATYSLPPWHGDQELRCCTVSRWARTSADGSIPPGTPLGVYPP